MGEAAAFATFVFAAGGAPNKLTGPGPFAPNVGTEENPAVSGFVLDGAAVEVPGAGKSGFEPDEVAPAPGTETFVPVGLLGTNPGAVGYMLARRGFAMAEISHLP